MRTAKLLVSRLSHDLASPVGAVMSGLELMQEFEGESAEDARRLMGDSARIAARRLAFFRLAFGFAGNAAGRPLAEARVVIEDFLAAGRVKLAWPEASAADAHRPAEGGIKLLLLLVVVAVEALPRGGSLAVVFDPGAGCTVRLDASGTGARVASASLAALAGGEANVGGLDALTAPAYYAGRVAQKLAAGLRVVPGADRVSLEAQLP